MLSRQCLLALRPTRQRVFQPPRRGFLALPNREEGLPVFGIIGANLAVFGGWYYAESNRDWRLYKLMKDHFTVSRDSALQRPHTLLTAAFSHSSGVHLLGNMVTLFFFGPPVVAALGVRSFMSLYLASGVASSACHAATARSPRAPALGASGALNAVVAYSILADPFRLIVVFAEFIPIPMPAVLYGGLFIGRDVAALWGTELSLPFGLGKQLLDANAAHAAHVGGAVCGAAFYLFRRGRGGGSGMFRRWR